VPLNCSLACLAAPVQITILCPFHGLVEGFVRLGHVSGTERNAETRVMNEIERFKEFWEIAGISQPGIL